MGQYAQTAGVRILPHLWPFWEHQQAPKPSINTRMLTVFPTERGKCGFSSFSTYLVNFPVNGFQHSCLSAQHYFHMRHTAGETAFMNYETAGKCLFLSTKRGGFPFANACPQEAPSLLSQGQHLINTSADLRLLLKTAGDLGCSLQAYSSASAVSSTSSTTSASTSTSTSGSGSGASSVSTSLPTWTDTVAPISR